MGRLEMAKMTLQKKLKEQKLGHNKDIKTWKLNIKAQENKIGELKRVCKEKEQENRISKLKIKEMKRYVKHQ